MSNIIEFPTGTSVPTEESQTVIAPDVEAKQNQMATITRLRADMQTLTLDSVIQKATKIDIQSSKHFEPCVANMIIWQQLLTQFPNLSTEQKDAAFAYISLKNCGRFIDRLGYITLFNKNEDPELNNQINDLYRQIKELKLKLVSEALPSECVTWIADITNTLKDLWKSPLIERQLSNYIDQEVNKYICELDSPSKFLERLIRLHNISFAEDEKKPTSLPIIKAIEHARDYCRNLRIGEPINYSSKELNGNPLIERVIEYVDGTNLRIMQERVQAKIRFLEKLMQNLLSDE